MFGCIVARLPPSVVCTKLCPNVWSTVLPSKRDRCVWCDLVFERLIVCAKSLMQQSSMLHCDVVSVSPRKTTVLILLRSSTSVSVTASFGSCASTCRNHCRYNSECAQNMHWISVVIFMRHFPCGLYCSTPKLMMSLNVRDRDHLWLADASAASATTIGATICVSAVTPPRWPCVGAFSTCYEPQLPCSSSLQGIFIYVCMQHISTESTLHR